MFTDNLDRTRRQLATNFESKSASLAAGAEWTDSIGGHWHLKILFDAAETEARSDTHSRTIWIFSDMMNQTPDFDIVRMLNLPPERMLERAKVKGAAVPLPGVQVCLRPVPKN